MNGIIYYSNTNQSKAVAEYFANKTGWEIYDLNQCEQAKTAANISFEKAVLIFPVYCQNVPDVVNSFLEHLTARYLTLVATYGKMCHGRTLYEIQQNYTAGEIIAAAYLPMKHSYSQEKTENTDFNLLLPILQKNKSFDLTPIKIKRTYKNIFANFGKNLRSRLIVKITYDKQKCIACGKCENQCLFNGITNGKTNGNCIRCLKCVTNCPTNALHFKNSLMLSVYLKKKPIDKCDIYV